MELARTLVATAAALVLFANPAHAADPTPTTHRRLATPPSIWASARQLRAERSQLLICSAASCPDYIRKECAGRLDDVNARIPTLVVTAKSSAGEELTAVTVTMDGEVLAQRLDGTPLPVDPGEHTFTFEAAGYPLITNTWMVRNTQKEQRQITFETATPPTSAAAPAGARRSESTAGEGAGTDPHTIAALVGVGVAVVGLSVGTAYGVLALSRKSAAQSVCPGSFECATQAGVNKWNSAASAANVANVMFVIAGLGAIEAAVFWLTPSSNVVASPQVGVGPGILEVKGAW